MPDKPPRVLIVEDEADIAELLRFTCRREGFDAVVAASVTAAQSELRRVLPDVLILDRMLPEGDGLSLLRSLRGDERSRDLPVLMLTARAAERDKLEGLDCGADDYLTKPFSPKELMARVRAVLRRVAPHRNPGVVALSGCLLDDDRLGLTRADKSVSMSAGEYRLLKFFLTHAGKTYSRRGLLDSVWGDHVFIEERTVDVHVLRLRKILGAVGLDSCLETVRGVGYRWNAP